MASLRRLAIVWPLLFGCNELFGIGELRYEEPVGAGGAASSSTSASSANAGGADVSSTASSGGNGGSAGAPPMPWLEGWMRRKAITFDSVLLDRTALEDFPAPLLLVDADIAAHALPSGDDIVATAGDGVTPLASEVERFSASDELLVAWVRVPLLAVPPMDDTTIYLYYENPVPRTFYDPSDVWGASAAGVWHLGNDPTDPPPQFSDSTSHGNDGGSASPSVSPNRIDGVAGKALEFDGSDDVAIVGDPSDGSLDFDLESFSYSFWVKAGTAVGDQDAAVFKGGDTGAGYHVHLGLGSWDAIVGDGTSSLAISFGIESDYQGSWTHLATVVDRSAETVTTYANGTPRTSASIESLGSTAGGSFFSLSDNASYRGGLDEVRVWRTALSPAWIALEHDSLSAQDVFRTVGPEELAP